MSLTSCLLLAYDDVDVVVEVEIKSGDVADWVVFIFCFPFGVVETLILFALCDVVSISVVVTIVVEVLDGIDFVAAIVVVVVVAAAVVVVAVVVVVVVVFSYCYSCC